ncbi:MAG: manganese-binding transcriptional regulator MntR [Salinisphaera sp.]|nr:manganese-binding transcriptional regulator MntR [Salinisphaera sp.]
MGDHNPTAFLEHVAVADTPGELPPPDLHAAQHAQVRKAHETELIEDYVELIADLIDAKGEARAVELARRMAVTQATVGKMVRRLAERGLVRSEPYRAIFLTAEGRRMAEASRRRHLVVLRFLRAIGVPENTARQDAEGIEHHASKQTLAAMRRFTDRLQ